MNDQMRDAFDVALPEEEPLSALSPDSAVGAGRKLRRRRQLGWAGGITGGLAAFAAAALLLPTVLGGSPDSNRADDDEDGKTPESAAQGGAADDETEWVDDPDAPEPQPCGSEYQDNPYPDVSFDWPEASQAIRDAFAEAAPEVPLARICGHPDAMELARDGDSSEGPEAQHLYADALVGEGAPENMGDSDIGVDLYLPGGWDEEDAEFVGPGMAPVHLPSRYFCENESFEDYLIEKDCSEEETVDGVRVRTYTETVYKGDDVTFKGYNVVVMVDDTALLVGAGADDDVELDVLKSIALELSDLHEMV